MKLHLIYIYIITVLFPSVLGAQEYSWECIPVDGRITGCKSITVDNLDVSLGKISRCGRYVSPSGKRYPRKSSTARVAALVCEAQADVAHVKQVIARSESEMPNIRREGALSNWVVNVVMEQVAEMSGCKVDVGICNYGGIRTGIPEGDVILDDILSMFPFRNTVVYLQMSGMELLHVLQGMAERKFEAVGGVTVEVEGKKVISVTVGDQPLDEDKIYGVATISFLLDGGDGLFLARHASSVQMIDVLLRDVVMNHVTRLSEAGQPIRSTDVRHVIIR